MHLWLFQAAFGKDICLQWWQIETISLVYSKRKKQYCFPYHPWPSLKIPTVILFHGWCQNIKKSRFMLFQEFAVMRKDLLCDLLAPLSYTSPIITSLSSFCPFPLIVSIPGWYQLNAISKFVTHLYPFILGQRLCVWTNKTIMVEIWDAGVSFHSFMSKGNMIWTFIGTYLAYFDPCMIYVCVWRHIGKLFVRNAGMPQFRPFRKISALGYIFNIEFPNAWFWATRSQYISKQKRVNMFTL